MIWFHAWRMPLEGTVTPAAPEGISGEAGVTVLIPLTRDQTWWHPATDGIPLTQGDKLPKRRGPRKRKLTGRFRELG
jgi:hypothetical protein